MGPIGAGRAMGRAPAQAVLRGVGQGHALPGVGPGQLGLGLGQHVLRSEDWAGRVGGQRVERCVTRGACLQGRLVLLLFRVTLGMERPERYCKLNSFSITEVP